MELYEYCLDSTNGVQPMMIFSPAPDNLDEFEYLLERTEFKYPIYADYEGEFELSNPQFKGAHRNNVFLMDKNNRIVLIGNPYQNSNMWALYKKNIKRLGENQNDKLLNPNI